MMEALRSSETLVLTRATRRIIIIIIIIIIINFKLRVGFHPVAVALKRYTNKTYYIQNTDNIHIKYTKQQNTKHTHQITKHTHQIKHTYHIIQEDAILHSHRRENLKYYNVCKVYRFMTKAHCYTCHSSRRSPSLRGLDSVSVFRCCLSSEQPDP
jgi:hypothetical protein